MPVVQGFFRRNQKTTKPNILREWVPLRSTHNTPPLLQESAFE